MVNSSLNTERETVHISDDKRHIVQIDGVVMRYQIDNHLGGSAIELDENGGLISYEEYHPFGTTSYRSGRSAAEVSLKRHRYVTKEKDEETGLYYYGMRYYDASIAKFISVDPLAPDYLYYTPYQYAGNKPISYIDLDGGEEKKVENELIPKDMFGRQVMGSHHMYSEKFKGIDFIWSEKHLDWTSLLPEVSIKPEEEKEEEPWIVFGANKPFKLFGYTVFHSSHYYEGKRGFYERGGGFLALTTALTVSTMGLGGGFGGSASFLKNYWKEVISTKAIEHAGGAFVDATSQYLGGIKQYGWGWKNISNINGTSVFLSGLNPKSRIFVLGINGLVANTIPVTIEQRVSIGSYQEIAIGMGCEMGFNYFTGKVDGGVLLKRSKFDKNEISFLKNRAKSIGREVGNLKSVINLDGQYLYRNSLLINDLFTRPSLGIFGGTIKNATVNELKN